jgi:aspartate/methionine/tyrosine aminotransferase
MGSVIPRESFERLLTFIESNSLVLIVDETYRSIIHQKIKFTSPLEHRKSSSRIILLRSFSKGFSMSGLRIGYIYYSSEEMDKINAVHLAMNMSASVLSQSIALELFQYGGLLQEEIKQEYSKRYKIVASFLDKWKSVFDYVPPTTGFFVFPRYNLKFSSIDLFRILLNKYHVAVRPGSEFGKGGEGHIRISFAYPIQHIRLGLQKITNFLNKYKK